MSLTFFAAPDRESQLKVIHIAQHTSARASPPRHIITRHSSIAPPVASSHEHERQTLAGWGEARPAQIIQKLGAFGCWASKIYAASQTHTTCRVLAQMQGLARVLRHGERTLLLPCVNLGVGGHGFLSDAKISKMVAVHGVFDKSQWHKCHGLAQILKNYKEAFLDTAT